MNDNARAIRRPRRAWPPTLRSAAAIIAAAGLCSLAAACASPSSTGAAGTSSAAVAANVQTTLTYSQCIRSHGVPNFPNPDTSGNLPADAKQIGASSPKFDAASAACNHLLPADDQPKPARTGGDSQSQPPKAKGGPGSGSQSQPPLVKPTPGGS